MANNNIPMPSAESVRSELRRERNRIRYRTVLKNTVYALIVVAAVAVLIATLVLPVLQISGTSMEPTLRNGEIVVLLKTSKLKTGELCGFSYSNKILIKRVIAVGGDTVSIDRDGAVTVNGETLKEEYLTKTALGECDIEFPFTVPPDTYFVMGDERETSIDSRSSVIGCIGKDEIVGRLFLKVWPLDEFEIIN